MGRKPQEQESVVFRARVASTTPERLEKLAAAMGKLYGGKGQPGAVLDLLASGDWVLVPRTSLKSVAQLIQFSEVTAVNSLLKKTAE